MTDINTPSMKHSTIETYGSYRASNSIEDSYIKRKKTKTYTISTISARFTKYPRDQRREDYLWQKIGRHDRQLYNNNR